MVVPCLKQYDDVWMQCSTAPAGSGGWALYSGERSGSVSRRPSPESESRSGEEVEEEG